MKINTFHPVDFKRLFIGNPTDKLWFQMDIDHFFIHSFHSEKVDLKLPLPLHKKTVHDIMFIVHGSSARLAGLHRYELKKADLLFVPRLTASNTEFMTADIEGYYCHFSDEMLQTQPLLLDFFNQMILPTYLHFPEPNFQRVNKLLQSLWEVSREKKNQTEQSRLQAFYLACILAEISLLIKEENQQKPSKGNKLYKDFLSLAKTKIMHGWTLKQYADALNITPNHLNKTIKMLSNRSANDLLNELKIQEAKVLLLQTPSTLAEIAYLLGFTDQAHFGKFFKKHNNHTPSQYRKMIDMY
ncbi:MULTISPECIES: AraC family transcriptional regulator [Sphingobacterium]|uniref:Helix-turn-helix transcriptional regulator n=1 Tax=Sphingobacterium tenebrionis TaxID=3111775 RepID=A0ABU8I6M1_9SPHI|nr:AraC family transcriptional regulator [Sphingobacterium sp. CZ-2]QBR11386.1 AraC family transcriptional regulator [Sphingobacterium sp. CZ-2]